MDSDLKTMLETLATKLGATGEELFRALVHRSRVYGALTAGFCVLLAVTPWIAVGPLLRMIAAWPVGTYVSDSDGRGLASVAVVLAAVVASSIATWSIKSGLTSLFAPEGDALAWLISWTRE